MEPQTLLGITEDAAILLLAIFLGVLFLYILREFFRR